MTQSIRTNRKRRQIWDIKVLSRAREALRERNSNEPEAGLGHSDPRALRLDEIEEGVEWEDATADDVRVVAPLHPYVLDTLNVLNTPTIAEIVSESCFWEGWAGFVDETIGASGRHNT